MSRATRQQKHKQRQYASRQNALLARQQRRDAFARAHGEGQGQAQGLRARVESALHDAQNTVTHAAESLLERVRHAGEQLAHKATELAEHAQERVTEQAGALVDQISGQISGRQSTASGDESHQAAQPTSAADQTQGQQHPG